MGSSSRPHAVPVPYPAQGHITPLLHLAKALHARGFHVTYVNTEYNHRRLLRSRGATSLAGLDDFRFETIPDGQPPGGDDNEDVTQDIPTLCASFARRGAGDVRDTGWRDELHAGGGRGDGHPGLGVLDHQRVWLHGGTSTSPSSSTEATCHSKVRHSSDCLQQCSVDKSNLTNGYVDTVLDWVPGMPGIRLRDIPASSARPTGTTSCSTLTAARRRTRTVPAASSSTRSMRWSRTSSTRCASIFPRVYAVGPLLTFARAAAAARAEVGAIGGNLRKEDASCLRWPDARPPGSVVYANFGSITVMTPAHLAEFAWGLASCGRPFLWVIRPDLVTGETAGLPEERGILLSWYPQDQVLRHPATGLFLTHSGWNSTLESICELACR